MTQSINLEQRRNLSNDLTIDIQARLIVAGLDLRKILPAPAIDTFGAADDYAVLVDFDVPLGCLPHNARSGQ